MEFLNKNIIIANNKVNLLGAVSKMVSDYIIVAAIGIVIVILCIVALVIGIKAPKQEFKKLTKKESYNNYMKSDEWQLQRLKALRENS